MLIYEQDLWQQITVQYLKNKWVYSQMTLYYLKQSIFFFFCCIPTCLLVSVLSGGRSSRFSYGWRSLRLHQTGRRRGVHSRRNQGLLQRPGEDSHNTFFDTFPVKRVCNFFICSFSDRLLQDSSLRTFRHQLPAHYHREGKAASIL